MSNELKKLKPQLDEFNAAYKKVMSLSTRSEEEARLAIENNKDLLQRLDGRGPKSILPISDLLTALDVPYKRFGDTKVFSMAMDKILETRELGVGIRTLNRVISQGTSAPALKRIQEDLQKYASALQDMLLLLAPGPSSLRYKGFHVSNPEGAPEAVVQGILFGIDEALNIFKRRGLLDTLYAGVQKIHIAYDDDKGFYSQAYKKNMKAAGFYVIPTKTIIMYANTLKPSSTGRFIRKWVTEVFIHEFGHFVHLAYLTKDAKEFYDSGWQMVEEAKAIAKVEITVTEEDRAKFLDRVIFEKGDVQKAGRPLKGLDRLKFLWWLYAWSMSSSYKQVRLTQDAKDNVFKFFEDPKRYIKEKDLFWGQLDELEDEVHRQKRFIAGLLGVSVGGGGSAISGIPTIPTDIVQEMRQSEIGPIVEKALKDLGLPSTYAKENVKEDFAETFALYILNPSRLSDVARWRMGRALGMSGSGGKQVMHTAKKVAARWLAAKTPP